LHVATRDLVRTLHALDSHTGSDATGVTFFAGGERIASVSYNGVVRLWEIAGGTMIGILETEYFRDFHLGIMVSDDGTSITVFNDQTSRGWGMVPGLASSNELMFFPQDHVLKDESYALYTYNNFACWILNQHGQAVFWLPPHLRGFCHDCRGSVVAIGTALGRVFWFDFGFLS
jgi:hypothetical protein